MRIKKTVAAVGIVLGAAAGSIALSPAQPAEAASASQYVWGSNAADCRYAAKRYVDNWKFGYQAATIPPCQYDRARGSWWTKVTLYY
jgi:hypothetical protein